MKAPRHVFPLAVAAAFLLLLVGYRCWSGAGFGPGLWAEDGEAIASGFLYNDQDNFSYASWVKQAQQGSLLFTNLHAAEDHGSIYFNPYFLFAGRVASLLGLPVTAVMVMAGAAASVFTIWSSFHSARLAGLSLLGARWTTILVAFASGLSWPILKLAPLFGRPVPAVGADLSFQDAIPFSTAFAYPYQSVSLALLAAAILLALANEDRAQRHSRKLPLAALACVAVFVGTTHPYEGVMLLGTYALYVVTSIVRAAPERNARIVTGCVLAACIGPTVLYALWISRQPVWSDFAAMAALWHPRSYWVIGYGLVLPLAVLASIAVLSGQSGPRWWPAIWTIVVACALIGINVEDSKLSSGAFLPMSLMAGHGIAGITERIARIRAPAVRRLALASGLMLSVGFFPTSVYLLARIYENKSYDPGIAQAALIVEASESRFPRVLCGTRAGSLLPALAAARVFVGNWAMSPRSASKRDRLIQAGIEPPRGKAPVATDERVFRDLVAEFRAEFIVLPEGSPAVSFADDLEQFELASAPAPWRIWRRL